MWKPLGPGHFSCLRWGSNTVWPGFYFDFIECFMTTFLHTHSWLNWVDDDDDEDEVGLKEKARRH